MKGIVIRVYMLQTWRWRYQWPRQFFEWGGLWGSRHFREQVYMVANNALSQYGTNIQFLTLPFT